MMSGIGAVAKKDLREHRTEMLGTRADLVRALLPAGMFGIFMPIVLGEMLVAPGFLPALAAALAASLTAARAGDSVAGERDRGTLEMLLTTPLSDREIVLGKIAALVVVGVLGTVAAVATMIPVLAWRHPAGVAAMATGVTLIAILVPSLLVATFVAASGVIVSARAPSGRAAQSRMGMGIMAVLFVPVLVAGLLSESQADALEATARTLPPDVVVAGLVLLFVTLDITMVSFALARFRRSRIVVL